MLSKAETREVYPMILPYDRLQNEKGRRRPWTSCWRFLVGALTVTTMAPLLACAGEQEQLRTLHRSNVRDPGTSEDASSSSLDPTNSGTPADAGAPDRAPVVTAFGDARAYAKISPSTQSALHHWFRSNAGKDCLSCHDGTNLLAPRFLIAGTVYESVKSTTGARDVQVRVVDDSGGEVAIVGTDDSGNFWLEAGANVKLPEGASVGVRNAQSTKLMGARIGGADGNTGSCNQSDCHGSDRKIVVQ